MDKADFVLWSIGQSFQHHQVEQIFLGGCILMAIWIIYIHK